MWEKMAFWILQAPYYRMDAVVTVEETWRVWFAQGHTTEKAGPALEPLPLSDPYVTEMRRSAHSPESESSSTTTMNCAGNHHCLLAGLQRKGREKVDPVYWIVTFVEHREWKSHIRKPKQSHLYWRVYVFHSS